MKSLLRWAELVAPYLAGAVFWVAAAAKVWALPDWAPYLLRGDAEVVSYLGMLAVLIEVPLGLFLIFSNSKGMLCVLAMGVLVVFTGYLAMFIRSRTAIVVAAGGSSWRRPRGKGSFGFR